MRAILAAHALDLATFVLAVGILGLPVAELNPIAVRTYQVGGFVLVLVAKVLAVAVMLALISRVRTRPRRFPILLAYSIGVLGFVGNLGTIAGVGARAETIAPDAPEIVAPGVDLSEGDASYVAPAFGRLYLALPDHEYGRPVRVEICGPADCVIRASTDSGPDLSMQRAGRIADLSYVDFGTVCGCSPATRGLVEVRVTRLGRGPTVTLPPTDTEE